ncbi:MAG: ATP-binding protein [Gemmatimonadaceae bacterium]|jgi:signal transduction histidine kinase|nr:ATP-binding protein [Gemmatimonadaceae bacterium]
MQGAELQVQRLTSHLVELAIQGPALAALVGAAMTLRRPGMAHLAWAWSLFATVSVVTSIGLRLQMLGHPWALPLLITSYAPTFGALLMLWDSVDAVAGSGRSWQQSVRRAAVVGLVLTGLLALITSSEVYPLGAISVGRAFYLATTLGVAWRAWRRARLGGTLATALGLLSLAGLLGALRVIARMVIDLDQQSTAPMLPDSALVISTVLHQSMFVLTVIMVVLMLERAAISAQSAALTRAERELAAGRRLESLGKMASAIAHDFNNVLTVILTGVESATTAAPHDDAMRREGLRDAQAGAERAKSLAERLLDFARARPVAPVVLPTADRIAATADVWRRLVRLPAQLEVVADGTAPSVRMDPVQFDQVLLNLVANAADAVATGGTVRVAVGRRTVQQPLEGVTGLVPPGEYASVRVEDTGGGMTPEVLRNAFEPFFTTKGDRGTGLGLATVLAIVRDARGDVLVETAEGKGTRFEVLLPGAP